jgi:chorismate mutase
MDSERESKIKGMGMTEQQRIEEREEIAARVANFKATQEKFRREREEYCSTTLENARHPDSSRRTFNRTSFGT